MNDLQIPQTACVCSIIAYAQLGKRNWRHIRKGYAKKYEIKSICTMTKKWNANKNPNTIIPPCTFRHILLFENACCSLQSVILHVWLILQLLGQFPFCIKIPTQDILLCWEGGCNSGWIGRGRNGTAPQGIQKPIDSNTGPMKTYTASRTLFSLKLFIKIFDS